MPPLVGYAAASGNLGLPALWLFLIVFLWTPTRRNAGVLFHYSLLYLALLFVAAALDPVLL